MNSMDQPNMNTQPTSATNGGGGGGAAAAAAAAATAVDRSDDCIEYLTSRIQMDLASLRECANAARSLPRDLTPSNANAMTIDPSAASLSAISHIDRGDECIDYLIARAATAHQVAVEESLRLRQGLLARGHIQQQQQLMTGHAPPVTPFQGQTFTSPLFAQGHYALPPLPFPPQMMMQRPFVSTQAPVVAASYSAATANAPSSDSTTAATMATSDETTADQAKSQKRKRVDFNTLWHRRYDELLEFKEANGHCNIPQRYASNVELGRWVKDQRTFKKQGKLSQERVGLLDKIGFTWKVRSSDDFWNKMCKDLIAYKEANGHCKVSMTNTTNLQLARWVDRQRRAKKEGKISDEKIQQLTDIGFSWKS
eukprot:scaffold37961_cov79-Cyclotella_meneghiniana.AAC.5